MTHSTINREFLPLKHNHARCIETAVREARNALKVRGLELTPLREAIYREFAASHRSIGAYDVRESLKAKGQHVQPMSIYRTIETFIQAGIVRRFETGNAFYAIPRGNPRSTRVVLACRECGCICDIDAGPAVTEIVRIVESRAFAPRSAVIEVLGICNHRAKPTEQGEVGLLVASADQS